jgi:hypothetical protein
MAINQFHFEADNANRFNYKCSNVTSEEYVFREDKPMRADKYVVPFSRNETKYTDWHTGGGNGLNGLDHHDLDCGENKFITSFLLEAQYWWKDCPIRFKYQCKEWPVENYQCRDLSTEYTEIGSDKTPTLIYLDKHNVKCAANEGLRKFKVGSRGDAKNNDVQIKFDYKCCSMVKKDQVWPHEYLTKEEAVKREEAVRLAKEEEEKKKEKIRLDAIAKEEKRQKGVAEQLAATAKEKADKKKEAQKAKEEAYKKDVAIRLATIVKEEADKKTVNIRMYIYMYIGSVNINIYIHVYLYTYTYIYIHAHIQMIICIYTYIHMNIIYIYVYIYRKDTYMYRKYTYIYIYVHIYL